jgi:hypothetical protein
MVEPIATSLNGVHHDQDEPENGIQSVLRDNTTSDLEKTLAHQPTTLDEALTQLSMVRASLRPKSVHALCSALVCVAYH